MTEVGMLANKEPAKMNFPRKTVHTSALSDHDYVGAKKYVIVPIPDNVRNIKKPKTPLKTEKEKPLKTEKIKPPKRIVKKLTKIAKTNTIAIREAVKATKKKKEAVKKIGKTYNCNFCPYSTNNKVLNEKHKVKHENIKLMACNGHCKTTQEKAYFQCPNCSFIAKTFTGLRIHSKIHSKGTPFKCIECEFFGKDLKELIKHYAEVKDLKCYACSFKTHEKSAMVLHKRTHTTERPFSCGICGSAFAARCNLHRHMKTHTNVKLIEIFPSDLK